MRGHFGPACHFRLILAFGFSLLWLSLAACSPKSADLPEAGPVNAAGREQPYEAAGETAPAAEQQDAGQVVASLDDYDESSYSLDDYDDDDPGHYDPFEPWNRFWFKFNDVLLLKVFKPINQGYTAIVPSKIRRGVANFANNLKAPIRFVNFLLQAEFGQAGVEFGRFFINTVTSLGFADTASREKPLFEYNAETATFGYTLAKWGIPAGPYLVWPILGPSTARGTVGTVGDAFMSPYRYALDWPVNVGANAYFTLNDLESVISAYESMRRIAVEPYSAVRSGYYDLLRRREIDISTRKPWFSGSSGPN